MSNYRLVIYSKEEDGILVHESYRDLWTDVKLDIGSFKQLDGWKYPNAVWSVYDFTFKKWSHWKEKV